MFIIGIAVIAAIVYLIVSPGRQRGIVLTGPNEAEQILRKRYVSGEIDDETYKKMLRTLQSY